ncbi:Argininosuccinate lyase [Nymphon striatum]|nr:Argininosuccinate lyase [Nymphon striatum]
MPDSKKSSNDPQNGATGQVKGQAADKLWGGRFTESTDAFVEAFTASINFDQRLYKHDIAEIQADIESGNLEWSVQLEDIHMNIEARLTDKIGITGKKLHTGRSRNDQIATDIRLWLREEIDAISSELKRLQSGLLKIAEQEADTILPGFTHLQVAQPITFGHHMLAWYEMLVRDFERLQDCRKRVNIMPLGSAALAGTTYPIDRAYTAELLGFERPCNNSLDGTVFCTGSSIMPQKKNPDVPELVRGKSGRVFGSLFSLLTLMKSQPLAYNKDNQEDKEPIFDTVDTLLGSLRAFADMVPNITTNKEAMRAAAMQGFSTATDLADYLVGKDMPFRDAHEVVGSAVAYGVEQGKDLSEMSLEELQQFSTIITEDVFEVLTLEGSVAARNHLGGTAPEQVKARIAEAKKNG